MPSRAIPSKPPLTLRNGMCAVQSRKTRAPTEGRTATARHPRERIGRAGGGTRSTRCRSSARSVGRSVSTERKGALSDQTGRHSSRRLARKRWGTKSVERGQKSRRRGSVCPDAGIVVRAALLNIRPAPVWVVLDGAPEVSVCGGHRGAYLGESSPRTAPRGRLVLARAFPRQRHAFGRPRQTATSALEGAGTDSIEPPERSVFGSSLELIWHRIYNDRAVLWSAIKNIGAWVKSGPGLPPNPWQNTKLDKSRVCQAARPPTWIASRHAIVLRQRDRRSL